MDLMNAQPIEAEVVEPEPGYGLVAYVELLTLDPREYSGLQPTSSLVARELLKFSFGPASEQLFRIWTLAQVLGLQIRDMIWALVELEDRRLIDLNILTLSSEARTSC